MNLKRVTLLKNTNKTHGPVVYWMSRDQRAGDNWALVYAQELAIEQESAMVVVFCLVPKFLDAAKSHYHFMIKGLKETENSLQKRNIPFFLLQGAPDCEIPAFIEKYRVGALIIDFNPLRIKQGWNDTVAQKINIPFYEVDAHNIVPCRMASTKPEYGAYTLRPKIHRLLPEFLDEYPSVKKHPVLWDGAVDRTDWNMGMKSVQATDTGQHFSWIEPGEKAASPTFAIRGVYKPLSQQIQGVT